MAIEVTKLEVLGTEVVYGHKMKNEPTFFHIGSGSERRARTFTGRSSRWLAYVNAHGGQMQVEVTIMEQHHCPARARLRDMQLVELHQPATNGYGRSSIPAGILDGRPKGSAERCACGAVNCYGAEVTARHG